jgi:type III pantothenate kinase
MLLTIDIGNSNIVLGAFKNDKLVETQRIETNKNGNVGFFTNQLTKNLGVPPKQIQSVMIGSVVPELDEIFTKTCKALFAHKPLFADTTLDTGLKDLSCKPSELGADRLADIVAATTLYPGRSIVVDMGTAIKFEAISDEKEYLGGAISPGIGISFRALIRNASKLENLKLSNPTTSLGTDTASQLNSGFILGFSSLISGMIAKMRKELKWESCTVIGTGGFIELIAPYVPEFTKISKQLTLDGLRLLWERNSNH